MIHTVIRNILPLIITTLVLAGCASKMSEEDKFLWNESTNAPSAHR